MKITLGKRGGATADVALASGRTYRQRRHVNHRQRQPDQLKLRMGFGLGENRLDLRSDRIHRPVPVHSNVIHAPAIDQMTQDIGLSGREIEGLTKDIAETLWQADL